MRAMLSLSSSRMFLVSIINRSVRTKQFAIKTADNIDLAFGLMRHAVDHETVLSCEQQWP